MIRMAGVHRTNKRDVISLLSNVRKQVADFDATLSSRRKLPVGTFQKDLLLARPVASFRMVEDDLLAMIGKQLRLMVKRIDV